MSEKRFSIKGLTVFMLLAAAGGIVAGYLLRQQPPATTAYRDKKTETVTVIKRIKGADGKIIENIVIKEIIRDVSKETPVSKWRADAYLGISSEGALYGGGASYRLFSRVWLSGGLMAGASTAVGFVSASYEF